MGETIAVLFIFFVIVLLGFVFYVKFMQSSIEAETEEIKQDNAIKIAQRALYLPELQCSEKDITGSLSCVDILKLNAAGNADGAISRNVAHYFDKIGYCKITVDSIYPLPNSWLLYDFDLPGFKDKTTTRIPIMILNATDRSYAFGVMKVEMYEK